MTLVAQRIADGRVLRLIESMLKAGCFAEGKLLSTETGTPQGLHGVLIKHQKKNVLGCSSSWMVLGRGEENIPEMKWEDDRLKQRCKLIWI